MAKVETTTIEHVNPNVIRADVNYRYNLIPSRVERLKEAILESNGVQVALEVEPLENDPDGFEYLLVDGYYRHAAVTKANESGAGLKLPIKVVDPMDEVTRLKTQLGLNLNRENNSPIDSARAMKALMDQGVSRQDIREIFVIKSGKDVRPCSNSHLNIHLRMLDLPKKIQNAIHNGEVGVASAYEIGKAMETATAKGQDPKAVANEIYEDAVMATLKAQTRDAEEDQKLLDAEKKAEAEAAKVREAQDAVSKIKEVADKSAKAVADFSTRAKEAFNARTAAQNSGDADAYKAADAEFKAAEKSAQDAEKIRAKHLKEQKAAEEKAKKMADAIAERKEKLSKLRKTAEAPAKVDPKAVKKAAAKATGGPVALNAAEMRTAVHSLTLSGGYAKVAIIGRAIESCFSGVMTEQQMYYAIAEVTGEREPSKVKVKAKAAKQ